MSEERRSQGWLAKLAAGVIIGAVEVVLAVAFAALVFAGATPARLGDGIGLYLVAAALTLGFLAWRAGERGVVGSVQDAATAVLSILALSTAYKASTLVLLCQNASVGRCEVPDVFLTVVAATLVVTVSCGAIFFVLGTFRLGNLVRLVLEEAVVHDLMPSSLDLGSKVVRVGIGLRRA